jgi:rsbT co-antagonist protein RsbR
MSESLNVEMLTRMLDRMPGVAFCSRVDPAVGKGRWVYLNERAAELYDVDPVALKDEPRMLLEQVLPEDRPRAEAVIARCVVEGVSMDMAVRVRRRDDSIRWLETHANVERDADGSVYWYGHTFDVTERKQLEAELHTRNQQLAESEETNTGLIVRLRHAVDELSNPILEVWDGVLAMPVIGVVDSHRTADMVQRLLGEVIRTQAGFVIVDLTGVDVVDTKTADHLMRLMRKVEVVGARCVLTGIRPAVAETLVDLGVDFGRLSTLRNLKHGLREALRQARREREGTRDQDLDEELVEDAPPRRTSR